MKLRQDISHPPRTIMEVYQMLPEGTLAELVHGVLYMSPAPTTNHQRTVLSVSTKLVEVASSLGEIFIAPCDVFLDQTSNAVQPDVIFVSSSKQSIVKKDAIYGVPDLIVEVLSQGNSQHDLVRKKDLYESFGVQEYWVIDPETKESIGYTLKGGSYIECGRATGVISSVLLEKELVF